MMCTAMTMLVGLAGFYRVMLPNRFFVSEGEPLMISSVFSITAKPTRSSYTVALTSISARSSRTTENTLMLFGMIPIKNVTASSVERPKLVPCGSAFGIKLLTDGVMVVDLAEVNGGCPAKECGIREGDIIISINGENIQSNGDVSDIIKRSRGKKCDVILKRDGKEVRAALSPVYSEGAYKAGMWVRDSSAGIGTLTFYNEETGEFAGLGHPVCDSDTGEILPLWEGAVGRIRLTGFIPSSKGDPGQLTGEFDGTDTLGEITLNCEEGLFGRLDKCPVNSAPLELGFRQEIEKGSATMLCSLDGGTPKSYSVEIEQINLSQAAEHDLVVKVTDKELIAQTGGIVQGMSGSPIIQNGRIVGAVTHVFIEDPTMGYGIFGDRMASKIN